MIGRIQTLRWPRLLAAFIVGISFAVSGALMQGVTNNPMASPSILGINAGASFGEEVAIGLGSNLDRVRAFAGVTVLILSGSAVALAGPIGFVGLITPHIVRKMVGIDYRRVIPFSALVGTVIVVVADVLTRLLNPPYETPLGAITAIIGVPFFIYLANRRGGGR